MIRLGMLIALALGGIRRTPLRVALTSLGVAIASGALVSMVAFALGLQQQIEGPFAKLGLFNNIEVKPKRDASGKWPALDDAAIERMAKLPGVEVAYPDFRVKGIRITRGEASETGMALGVPRETAILGVLRELLVMGESFSPTEEPEVILHERLARDLGFSSNREALGKTVTLEASGLLAEDDDSFRFERKQLPVKVVGIYTMPPIGPPSASRGVLLPTDLMKDIPGVGFSSALDRLRAGGGAEGAGYERATVRVERPSRLAAVEQAIGAMGFRTRTFLSRMEDIRTFFVIMDVLLAAVGTVALVVAALGIVNTLLMSVLERYREIGICKAIGASDADLVVVFLSEAAAIGLIGSAGGLLLGRAVAWILGIAINAYAQNQGVTSHLDVFAFPAWLLAATVGFAVLVSVLSGVFPAMRAARIDPIRALRSE